MPTNKKHAQPAVTWTQDADCCNRTSPYQTHAGGCAGAPTPHAPYPHPASEPEKTELATAVFNDEVPLNVAEVLMAMKWEDDQARAAMPKTGKGSGDWNPTWRILLDHINRTHDRVDALLAPLEFDYAPGRPLMVVKMGSEPRGWIPNAKHFDHVRRVLKAAGEDKRANILLNHYAIQIDERPRSPVAHRMDCGRLGAPPCPCQGQALG